MLAEQGQWHRCLEKAKEISAPVLQKYTALYAAQLIREADASSALSLYLNYGAPPLEANFNIYKRIAMDCFALREEQASEGLWKNLRDFLFKLLQVFKVKPQLTKLIRTMSVALTEVVEGVSCAILL